MSFSQFNLKKNTKNSLEECEEKVDFILDTLEEAIFLFNENKDIVKVNKVGLKLFDYLSKKEVLGKKINEIIPFKVLKDLINSENKKLELDLTNKNGIKFPALLKIEQKTLKDKIFNVLSVKELTQIRKRDKILLKQSKMAILGEMMGNIAHQWRQPLSIITTTASALKMYKELDILTHQLFIESIETITRNTQHLSQTIDDFRDFLKEDKEKTLFDVKKNIEKNILLLKDVLSTNSIEIIINCKKNLKINSYPNQLTHSFLNIINNSKDAFIEKKINMKNRYICIDIYEKKRLLLIEIKDNAGGIEPLIINKVFKAYFTTKNEDIGTGLGLYMTYQLINISMKGSIEVSNIVQKYDNKEYKGTCFTIKLPLENKKFA